MTREEMRIRRENKKAQRANDKLSRQLFKQEEKSWNKMVERAKAKDAWIEDNEKVLTP